MKVLLLAALIAAAASAGLRKDDNAENKTQWFWKVGKLYRYEVESHTLARLQEGSSTGSAFKTQFIVRVVDIGRLQAKLENPRHAEVHQELPKGKSLPEDLKYNPMQYLDQPFEIHLDGGRVAWLSLPTSLSLSHENLLKGLISALQVDLSTHRTLQTPQNTYDEESQQGQFKKMETDVTGDCETLYTVSPVASEWRRELPHFAQSEDPIEITKSKSYGHCHHRVAYHFGVPEGAKWTGTAHKTDEKQFMKHSMTSRLLVGKRGPILKAESKSSVYVHPHLYGKQKAEVHSYVRFNLISHDEDKEVEWQMKPTNEVRVVENLLFSMSTKQMNNKDQSLLSSSSESRGTEQIPMETSYTRQTRSVRAPRKIVSINKVIINHKNHEDTSHSSSSDSSSSYVDDDIPEDNELAMPYAILYQKQNPVYAQKLVQEIAQQLQNPNNMPKADFLSKFNILERIIASMDYEQLTQTSRGIEKAKSSNDMVKADMWMIYRDAVAQAGTSPAFQQIKSWIQTKKIQGEEAAQVVASMVNSLRFPTKKTMIDFFKLAMSDEVCKQKYLNSTALIAATRFINMGQVNNETAHSYYPTHMYGRLAYKHDNFVLEEVLPRLEMALEQAIKDHDSQKAQVYIKAIGNLGHRSILDVFAPYLEGKSPVSKYLRTLMINNLRVLAHQRDRYARAVLYSILRNTAEPYEVRVAAIQNIFVAHPTSAMMRAMAQMTRDDPSIQVRAVLKSGIESAANLKNPHHHELSRTARAASSLLTQEKLGQYYSTKMYEDYFDDDLELHSQLAYTGSEDSFWPKYYEYTLKSKISGWNTISATVSSIEQLFDYYKHQWTRDEKRDSGHKYSADKISEMLNIKRYPHDPLEAAIYMNIMNQQRYYTFSEDDLKHLPQVMNNYLSELSKGIEKHYTKVLNQAHVHVVFPLAMGMPFIFKYKEPTVIHIQSNAKITAEKEFLMEKEIQFTYARNLDGSVGFMDTLTEQIASVGIVNKIQLNIPVKMQIRRKSGEVKIQLEHLTPEQDTTIVHYSVWPYTVIQKKDTLVPVSQDPATKVISRNNKVVSTDIKFGQSIGTVYQLQGYSYSSDYKCLGKMFESTNLVANIASALHQKDEALTHYNFKYLGHQSQNKRVTFSATYDEYFNQKEDDKGPLGAWYTEDVTPNSEARRKNMLKRVASGINTARVQILDLSATFEGQQKIEYVLTAAMANSPVDAKMQYAFFAGKNSGQKSDDQINGVLTINKPETIFMNFLEALKKEMKMSFEADIKYGSDHKGNIHINGMSERTAKYAEELKNHPLAKQCAEEIARNNYYQLPCYKMILMAHAHDFYKASVTYKDVSPAFKYMIYRAYRIAEHFGFWYTDINPLKTLPDGKMDIEVQTNYLEHFLHMVLNSKYGEVRMKNVPIPKTSADALSVYSPLKIWERVENHYNNYQYQPFCSVDRSSIKTFSNRKYDYTLTRSWHVVMHDVAGTHPNKQAKDELVVLARRPREDEQEIYISYRSGKGQNLEIEIQPASEGSKKPQIKVNTDSKKVSEGDLIMYWDVSEDSPLLQYHTQPDGVLMLKIREYRLRIMYDGQRLVVLADGNRGNSRGICGYMSGEPRDDYKTSEGLVDRPEYYGASFSLHEEHSEPETKRLQEEAKKSAYQTKYEFTAILRSDSEWQKAMESSSISSEEKWGSQNVYRARNYSKQKGVCQVQKQVQYYENHGEICITTKPLDSCQSHCRDEGFKVWAVQVVCRPKLDQQFKEYKDQIRQGHNPQVSGVPKNRQYRVPTSCRA